jgi:hypothetical protein
LSQRLTDQVATVGIVVHRTQVLTPAGTLVIAPVARITSIAKVAGQGMMNLIFKLPYPALINGTIEKNGLTGLM